MPKEALTTSKWTVKLFRTLAKADPAIYSPYLVQSLDILSMVYTHVHDLDGSLTAIEKAIKISRSLQFFSTNIQIECQLGFSLCSLASTSRRKGNKEESLEAAQEAVRVYKNAINKHCERSSYDLPVGHFNYPWAFFFEDIPQKTVYEYGLALDQLALGFQALDRRKDAFATSMEALVVMMFFSNNFNNDSFEIGIADILYRRSHRYYTEFISLEKALTFSKRAVTLYRVHYRKDVETHGAQLYEGLKEHGYILEKLERYDEALVLLRETAELANIIPDQLLRAEALSLVSSCLRKLKRYEEAVSIRTESVTVFSRNKTRTYGEAHCQFDLGVELRLVGRRSEAIKALQAALTQFRALAFKNPNVLYTQYIGMTLNQLTMNFVHCKEFDQAFDEGQESLKIHESLLEKEPSVLDEYIHAIRLNSLAAEVADNEDRCVERARYNVVCARNLARLHPLEGNIVFSQMIQKLATVFCRFNRVLEAETAIQEALEWHEQNPSQDGKDVEQYMRCLTLTAAIVYGQGYLKKAEQYIQKSSDIGKPHSPHKSVCSTLVHSMHRRINILCVTGLITEAVEASKECVDFARQNAKEGIDAFIGCLQVAAIAFQYDGNFDEAIVHIQEALELSRGAEIIELSDTQAYVLLLEAKSLTYLARILADAGQEVQALVKGKAAVENALGLKSKYASLPWSDIEPTYIDALDTYSLRLAASGDLSGALDRLIEVRSFYESRIDSRLGDSLQLGCVLYAEGILCCAAGRPDDGAAAIAKLHDLQSRLGIVLPELARNVEITLERERTTPSMVALIKKLELKSNHKH